MTAALVFVFTYVALSIGRIPLLRSDRLAAAVIGGVALVALRVLTFEEAERAVDGRTLALLFGMMVLSAGLEISGAFAYAGHWITRRTKSPLALLAAIAVLSATLSAFMINDVVCIAFTPLVLQVATQLDRDPKPYLIALATSSNIGSVATITGNPQNILIASLSHISYGAFARALAPVAAIALVVDVAFIYFAFKRDLGADFDRGRLDAKPPRVYARWMWKSGIVTALVLAGFVVGVAPATSALLGAAAMLMTRAVNPKRLYVRIDWVLLALFTGLFVVVRGVEKAGLAERLLHALEPLHPESVWGLTAVTAILSNVVSNVPAVMVLKSIVPHLPDPQLAWLTLAMSSTLAGNLTLPGSLATIIVVERAHGKVNIGFFDFLKIGAPVAIVSLVLGAGWLALVK